MIKKLSFIALTLAMVVVLFSNSMVYAVEQPNLQDTNDLNLDAVEQPDFQDTDDLNLDAIEQLDLQNTDDININAVKRYPFNILVPRFGYVLTESVYTMTDGKYLKVHLETSGGKPVTFTAVDAKTEEPLDEPIKIHTGGTKTVYTNDSGKTQKIRIRLAARAPVKVRATGEFIFGGF